LMLEEAEDIGRRVRRARLRLGMPHADLADALGKSQGCVSKMECREAGLWGEHGLSGGDVAPTSRYA
jgi:ribosome-binding protein aMBF1 (putative translation factor)